MWYHDLMVDNGDKPATKSDLQAVQSELKEDIQAVRSELKEDIQALRSELKADIKRVAVAVVKTQSDIEEIKHDMTTKMSTKDDISRVLSAIDAFAKKSENKDKAITLHGPILTEVQVGLKDHEKRLKTLEAARP